MWAKWRWWFIPLSVDGDQPLISSTGFAISQPVTDFKAFNLVQGFIQIPSTDDTLRQIGSDQGGWWNQLSNLAECALYSGGEVSVSRPTIFRDEIVFLSLDSLRPTNVNMNSDVGLAFLIKR